MVLKTYSKVIGFSVAFGLGIWIADSAVDSLFFHEGSFFDVMILDPSPFELYIRILLVTCFAVFGVIMARVLVRYKKVAGELGEREETLRIIADTANDAILMMDDNGHVSFWNPAAGRMFGYTSDEVMGKELHLLLGHQRYYEAYKRGFGRFRETGKGAAVGDTRELMAIKKDGTEFPIELSLSAIQIKGKWHSTAIIRDITERKKTDEEINVHLTELVQERTDRLASANENLRREITERKQAEDAALQSEKFLNTVFDSIHDPFSIIDSEYIIVKANEAYAQMRGMRVDDLTGRKCYEVLQGRDRICDSCIVEKTFKSADPCAKDKFLTSAEGLQIGMEIFTYPIFNKDGAVSHVVEYVRDVTDRKKIEEEKKQLIEKLEHLSSTDGLTGLLNRRALIERLEYELNRAQRYGSELSLVLCDMDYFKEINDTYGHAMGDWALRTVAETLSGLLRKTDIAGRHGGDEFMLILPETSLESAASVAERIRQTVEGAAAQHHDKDNIRLSLSIGISNFRRSQDDINTLMKRADIALYNAKHGGRNRVSLS